MSAALCFVFMFFFFNDTATTEIYPLSLHDALPISERLLAALPQALALPRVGGGADAARPDRKSTRLNSSHSQISYAVFCLKKKKQRQGCHVLSPLPGQVRVKCVMLLRETRPDCAT